MPMNGERRRGLSLVEVLISASLFTIVILGISQTVLLMHRYSRATFCKYKAHLIATSYFESLLCDTHPYHFNGKTGEIELQNVSNPEETCKFNYYYKGESKKENEFIESVYADDENLKITMYLEIEESPLYQSYQCSDGKDLKRTAINPPEGFQSLRLEYEYTSPFSSTKQGSKDLLYAIRPLIPDDPEFNS